MTFAFDFDGRTWECRESVPDGVWAEVERSAARDLNRQTRKARQSAIAGLLAAAVVDYDDLQDRANADEGKLRELWAAAAQPLVDHYAAQRKRDG